MKVLGDQSSGAGEQQEKAGRKQSFLGSYAEHQPWQEQTE